MIIKCKLANEIKMNLIERKDEIGITGIQVEASRDGSVFINATLKDRWRDNNSFIQDQISEAISGYEYINLCVSLN